MKICVGATLRGRPRKNFGDFLEIFENSIDIGVLLVYNIKSAGKRRYFIYLILARFGFELGRSP